MGRQASPPPAERVCENCKIRKPISEFYQRHTAEHGTANSRQYVCKICNVELHYLQECRRQAKRDRVKFLLRIAEMQKRLAIMESVAQE